MNDKDIDVDILYIFKNYQEKYIKSLLNNMRTLKILESEHSVSGYQIFVRQFIIENIKGNIEKQRKINNKKLLFSYIFEKYSKDNDLLIKIINYLK
tara:strand:- start:782 stop:1069 length:288 start_codon:yes stop_codon:yes gene_type:complete